MFQRVETATQTATRTKNPHFDDPQVRAYTAKLRERIKNLADKGGKSLLLDDALQYFIKPNMRQKLQNSQTLKNIWAPLPGQKSRTNANGEEIQQGSPHWTWLLHAFASEWVNVLIDTNKEAIFGASGRGLRDKYEAGVQKFLTDHGGDYAASWNYVKRTFSRPIKNWYVLHRQSVLARYAEGRSDFNALVTSPIGKVLVTVAKASRQAWQQHDKMTPGRWIREKMNGRLYTLTGQSPAPTLTQPIPSSSSSSSSSSSVGTEMMAPDEF